MNCGLGVAERELLQAKLRRLPDTMPPRAVWQRIEAQARAEGLVPAHGPKPLFKWLSGAGLAAAVVLAVLNLRTTGTTPGTATADNGREFPTEPAYTARDDTVGLRNLNALMVRSQQLEQDLRSLPSEPHLVRAGTAATIAAVEDQIGAIDFHLSHARLNGSSVNPMSMNNAPMSHAPIRMTQKDMQLYWRERVRLMNLLVELRTAQARRRAF